MADIDGLARCRHARPKVQDIEGCVGGTGNTGNRAVIAGKLPFPNYG